VKAMSAKKVEKRTKVKPFVKAINYNHLMPTRYSVDFELKKIVDDSALNPDVRKDVRKQVKKVFEEKYRSQTAKNEKTAVGVKYFFSKLRF
jgi:large subunit ribosomal protein L27e